MSGYLLIRGARQIKDYYYKNIKGSFGSLYKNGCALIRTVSEYFSVRLLLVFLFLAVLTVLDLAFSHQSLFYCDQIQTLFISRRPVEEINLILSHEQNFAPYYVILHYFFLPRERGLQLYLGFSFLIWVLSIFVFYKILCLFSSHKKLIIFFLCLYVLTPAIYKYAFYLRMYGICHFAFLSFSYFFLKYLLTGKFSRLFFASLWLVFFSIWHPLALPALLLVMIVSFFSIRNKKDLIFFFMVVFISLGLVAYQLFLKTDLVRIFFTGGIEYIREKKILFYEFPSAFLFFRDGWEVNALGFKRSFLLPFFLLVLLIFIQFVRKYSILEKPIFFIFTFSFSLFFLSLILDSFASRHFIYLIGPFLTTLFLSVASLSRIKRRWVLLLLGFLFLIHNSQFLILRSKHRLYVKKLCDQVRKINSGVLVTDFYFSALIDDCINSDRIRVLVLLSNGQMVDAASLGEKELLALRAKEGGRLVHSAGLKFSQTMNKLLETFHFQETRALLKKTSEDTDSLYLIYGHDFDQLSSWEVKLFGTDFEFQEYLEPSIFKYLRRR